MFSALNDVLPLHWTVEGPHLRIAGYPQGEGMEAKYYIARNESIGYKVYPDWPSRDRAMNAQIEAAKVDIGPRVYGSFDAIWYGSYRYGYITEHVNACPDTRTAINVRDKLKETFYKVFGLHFTDGHKGNIGFRGSVEEGTPLIIDFGDCSF